MNSGTGAPSLTLVIPAAGSGQRLGAGIPKAFVEVDGKTLLERSILPFLHTPGLKTIAVAVPDDRIAHTREMLQRIAPDLGHVVIGGGARRQDSVLNAILASAESDFLAIHDAARIYVTDQAVQRCWEAAQKTGAAILALPATDTIKYSDAVLHQPALIGRTIPREQVWMAQTPQIVHRKTYLDALHAAPPETGFTDDAAILERAGVPVALVPGERTNVKITWPEDLMQTETKTAYRIGHGYDIHRLVAGRALVLGGVTIPFELGLDGHSDADVLLHALMDGMLGAVALGDIGKHFPNTDERWKGADSRNLLRHVNLLIREKGYSLVNADIMVIAERPKLLPHIETMRRNIASDTGVPLDCISVKATTAEKLGAIGRLEGIEAHASVLLSLQS
jgi:2-C-methyl-D-erythritol 2,4-cyclodiphosphate synthase/2-C-methyl-D-erythritol 4-phosphate cytidylyltransferase